MQARPSRVSGRGDDEQLVEAEERRRRDEVHAAWVLHPAHEEHEPEKEPGRGDEREVAVLPMNERRDVFEQLELSSEPRFLVDLAEDLEVPRRLVSDPDRPP